MSDLHSVSLAQPFTNLSVEYLFYYATQRSQQPHFKNGISLSALRVALKEDGQPVEGDWPYRALDPATPLSLSPPQGLTIFRATIADSTASIGAIISGLDSDRASTLCLRISKSFYQPSSGVVNLVPNDPDTGNHAVVAVGHGILQGDQMILVRNSWGKDWGLHGYGWLQASYLKSRLLSHSYIS